MINKPGETRTLRQIEDRLTESDPGLAMMLATLDADLGRARKRPRPPPTRGEQARHVAVLVVLGLLVVFFATMAFLTAS